MAKQLHSHGRGSHKRSGVHTPSLSRWRHSKSRGRAWIIRDQVKFSVPTPIHSRWRHSKSKGQARYIQNQGRWSVTTSFIPGDIKMRANEEGRGYFRILAVNFFGGERCVGRFLEKKGREFYFRIQGDFVDSNLFSFSLISTGSPHSPWSFRPFAWTMESSNFGEVYPLHPATQRI